MSQHIVNPELNNNFCICDAINCNAAATCQIEISAGPNGETILLSVCDTCVPKFRKYQVVIEEGGKTSE